MRDRRERFEEMYRQHDQRVLAYALRRAPAEVAKDAVADAFLAAWRRFDELPDDALPWLIAATRRTLSNHRRALGRQLAVAERLAREPLHQPEASTDGDAAAIRAALARLSADDREALTLLAWEGLSPTQAARALGCTASAFRVRLHRARRRLRAGLREIEDRQVRLNADRPARVEEVA